MSTGGGTNQTSNTTTYGLLLLLLGQKLFDLRLALGVALGHLVLERRQDLKRSTLEVWQVRVMLVCRADVQDRVERVLVVEVALVLLHTQNVKR